MIIKESKNNLATRYYFKIKDLETTLGKEKRERKKAESEADKWKRKFREAEEKIKGLEDENENLR